MRLILLLAITLLALTAQSNATEKVTEIVDNQNDVGDNNLFAVTVYFSQIDDGTYYGQGCGGSLIDGRWILTETHCISDPITGSVRDLSAVAVKLGTAESPSPFLDVDKVILHSDYQSRLHFNDHMLLRLTKTYNGYAQISNFGHRGGPVGNEHSAVDGQDVTTTELTATTPSVPGDLHALVYSDTAIELFWERSTDNGFIVSYEIMRNGTVVDTRNASSYFTDNLIPGTSYDWMVTAVDNDGNRSTAAEVTVETSLDGQAPDGPPIPKNFSAQRYSDTTAELFWDRSETRQFMYEIYRNDILLGISDGASFYMTDLERDPLYVFELVAIDRDGRRSKPAGVILDDPNAAIGDELAAPSNFRVLRYSDTTAELFWDRSDTPFLVYEIFRYREDLSNDVDDVITINSLGFTDGTSFFMTDLQAGADYFFEISASDPAGRFSVPDAVFLGDEDPADDVPEMPSGFRALRYSSTAAELFWDRSDESFIMYEIYRNDLLVGTSSGVSFFMTDLEMGESYAVSLIAIDSDGNQSDPTNSIIENL